MYELSHKKRGAPTAIGLTAGNFMDYPGKGPGTQLRLGPKGLDI